MAAIDRAILPGSVREIFQQLVEKGGLNIDHPSRTGMNWAKFHWGHPDQCQADTERPIVFFYGLSTTELYANTCEDRVQVSIVCGVQIDCTQYKTASANLEQLWYVIRRILGKRAAPQMNFDIVVTDSNGTETTYEAPTINSLGIYRPEVISSLSLNVNGKILRYQGQLLFDVYFKKVSPILNSARNLPAVDLVLSGDFLTIDNKGEIYTATQEFVTVSFLYSSSINSEYILAKDSPMLQDISVPDLDPGTYYFRARYQTSLGIVSPYSNTLTVLKSTPE